jgi:hypothetical protein
LLQVVKQALSLELMPLLSASVEFNDLGLIVVDEQHRFGVEQRDALKGKAKIPPHLASHDCNADSTHGCDDSLW